MRRGTKKRTVRTARKKAGKAPATRRSTVKRATRVTRDEFEKLRMAVVDHVFTDHYGTVLGSAVMGFIVSGITDAKEIATRGHEIARAAMSWTPTDAQQAQDALPVIDQDDDLSEPDTDLSAEG